MNRADEFFWTSSITTFPILCSGRPGRLHIAMDDGTEYEFGPGEIGEIPPGHDAWVVGDEAVVVIDISGMENYAKRK